MLDTSLSTIRHVCNTMGMESSAAHVAVPSPIPALHVPAWAWAVAALAAFVMYVVTLENGTLLGDFANTVHEFLHDGRHFAAVPCH